MISDFQVVFPLNSVTSRRLILLLSVVLIAIRDEHLRFPFVGRGLCELTDSFPIAS